MKPIERLKKLNTVENLWVYILSLLKKESHYAWEMPKLIEKNFFFKPGKITPYRVLYQLHLEGLVKSTLKERKRIYQITPKGKEELKKAENFYEEILKKIKG